MRICEEEIETFLIQSNYANRTKTQYKSHLKIFANFLSIYSDTPKEELYLNKIYTVLDINAEIIAYKPINSNLIDEYFFQNIHRGSSWLTMSRKAIGSFFKYLYRKYDFADPTFTLKFNINNYRTDRMPIKILNKHQILKLFNSIVTHSEDIEFELLLFTTLLTTGCRVSELIKIKHRDIHFEESTIELHDTKTRVERVIVLPINLTKAIKLYIQKMNTQSTDFLFPIGTEDVRKRLRRYLELGNLPIVNVHSLRHAFATMLFEAGTEITFIKQLLGHSKISSTKEYIHSNHIRNHEISIPQNESLFKNALKILKSL
ncbi:tyrosine-type recombinase/integrase [Bacillus mesophilum]|uniref:Tyrosine-type recombinase/integrase n=1 Tax=Bacillus mesophilum TaxID=1071718 RepID=A0A7V7UWR9_9BACI|nr:tyrosine-type recombinase/integrase [Bacillus mesophilum]KAB2335111.1 tyrosine-type recombinase/integrase [Bacillus mesophilum]